MQATHSPASKFFTARLLKSSRLASAIVGTAGGVALGASGISLAAPVVQPSASPTVVKSSSKVHEIRVTLFGQPCVLQGPLEIETLRAIHELSPEQIYPTYMAEEASQGTTGIQVRKAIQKLKNGSPRIPSMLDRYRERLSKRLNELLVFVEWMEAYKKDGNVAALIALSKKNLPARTAQTFEAAAKKLTLPKSKSAKGATQDVRAQLFEIYSEGIESDPQEEFHRAIRKMNVNYNCTFEETGPGEGD